MGQKGDVQIRRVKKSGAVKVSMNVGLVSSSIETDKDIRAGGDLTTAGDLQVAGQIKVGGLPLEEYIKKLVQQELNKNPGPQGPQGPQGPKGPAGPQGPQGSCICKSNTEATKGPMTATTSAADKEYNLLGEKMPKSWLPQGKVLGPVCYRMSRDGPPCKGNPSTFYKGCGSKGATLTTVKDTNGNVFGGYLTMSLTGGGAKKDPTAWIFTLKNVGRLGPAKLLYKKNGGGGEPSKSYG